MHSNSRLLFVFFAGTPISISISLGQNSVTSACGSSVNYNVDYSPPLLEVSNEALPIIDLTSGILDNCVSAWELEEVMHSMKVQYSLYYLLLISVQVNQGRTRQSFCRVFVD